MDGWTGGRTDVRTNRQTDRQTDRHAHTPRVGYRRADLLCRCALLGLCSRCAQHLKWFQRYQEPTTTTELYEQGTYKYFDGEQNWAEEIQKNFTFEYSFLEDEVQSS